MTSTESSLAAKSRVLIVDDHPILRHGIAQLINLEADLTVCAEADTVEQALSALSGQEIDLAIVDISLDGVSGIELLKNLKTRFTRTRALVVSMHDETLYAERALRAGARGYVMKQEAPKKIIAALRQVRSGELYLSERMQGRMLERMVQAPPAAAGAPPFMLLSDRELEVFRLIGQGLKKGEIARRIRRSVHTVEAHRASIKRKLNLRSGSELARLAYQAESG